MRCVSNDCFQSHEDLYSEAHLIPWLVSGLVGIGAVGAVATVKGAIAAGNVLFFESKTTFCSGLIVAFLARRVDEGAGPLSKAWCHDAVRGIHHLHLAGRDGASWEAVVRGLQALSERSLTSDVTIQLKRKVSRRSPLRQETLQCVTVSDHSITVHRNGKRH